MGAGLARAAAASAGAGARRCCADTAAVSSISTQMAPRRLASWPSIVMQKAECRSAESDFASHSELRHLQQTLNLRQHHVRDVFLQVVARRAAACR